MDFRKTYFNNCQHCSNNKEIEENNVSIKRHIRKPAWGNSIKKLKQIHPRKIMWIHSNYHSQIQSKLSVTKADWPKYSLMGNSWCFNSLNEELIQAPFRKKGWLELLTFLLLSAIIRNITATSWKIIKIIAIPLFSSFDSNHWVPASFCVLMCYALNLFLPEKKLVSA